MSLRNVKKQQQQQKVNSKHIFLQCIFGSLEEFSPMNIISKKNFARVAYFFLISKKSTLHVQHNFFLISKKETTLHVQHTFLYISLPLFYTTETSFYFLFTRFMEEMFVFVFTLFFHCRSFFLW